MRIAQIAPLYESVPPAQYGGTERIVSYVTEELVRRGHAVTLFASGDSVTAAHLYPVTPHALRSDPTVEDPFAHHVRMCEYVYRNVDAFDIVHSHIDYLQFPFARRSPHVAQLTTLHGRLDIPDLQPLYAEYADVNVVSISHNQRTPLPAAHWRGTVYNGLPASLYAVAPHAQEYLAFLGRISPEKGLDSAIAIAVATGRLLKIAAKVDAHDVEYFQRVIRPLLQQSNIEFVGEITQAEKQEFLGNAFALLFPVAWPEPFGIVMIEAMACGTPVIAMRAGAVPEVVHDGVTGFICESQEACVAAIERVPEISRAACRAEFEARFTDVIMTDRYLHVYQTLCEERQYSMGLL